MVRHNIRVTPQTRDKIKSLKSYKGESYDKIINRILDAKLGNMKITYELSDNQSPNVVYACIDYDLLEKNVVFNFNNTQYDGLEEINGLLPFSFRKRLGRIDLFDVLPLLDFGDSVVVNNVCLRNITSDVR